jgi:hypothetical protein
MAERAERLAAGKPNQPQLTTAFIAAIGIRDDKSAIPARTPDLIRASSETHRAWAVDYFSA